MPPPDNIQRHHDPAKLEYLIRPRTRLVLDSNDLLTEILLRLPAKSLTRFKSVCKRWQTIISSDQFCHQHTLRRPKLQSSLFVRLHGNWKYFYFNPNSDQKKLIRYNMSEVSDSGCQILQACNGLMLCRVGNSDGYTVYNPTTRRSRKILLTRNHEYPRFVGIHLAFDPSKSPYYKIVCIRSTDSHQSPCYHIEVYDSESHTWKMSLEAFTSPANLSSHATYWNNGIYWQGRDSFCCFDIVGKEMKVLSYPYSDKWGHPDLQESNGRLYCYRVIWEYVMVWELREDYEHRPDQWRLRVEHYIRKCDRGSILRLMMGRSDGDGDGDGDRDETCKMLIQAGEKIWSYKFDGKTYKTPLDLKTHPCDQPEDGRFYVMNVLQFGETLALV